MDLHSYIRQRKEVVEAALMENMPPENAYPAVLHRAMHYSVFAGGKRIRPILHLATAEACGGEPEPCMPFACALELIHTYSLIHDDLPAMDDDELRRGKPTNHVVFGEAIAILAGDALLTEAFHLIARRGTGSGLDPGALLWATAELAGAAGAQGMVGGQAMDILSEGEEAHRETVEYIHTHKTGALIRASVRTAAILNNVPPESLHRFTRFGAALGLAFQIRDDVLNLEGDRERMGKSVQTDTARGKMTYPAVFGLEESRRRLHEQVERALDALEPLDERADPLREIARYMMSRDH
jgi:geranylgeranyl diphosphate synthase type II